MGDPYGDRFFLWIILMHSKIILMELGTQIATMHENNIN